ncbi:MAG: hypothetical protein U9R19_09920 [Bacteroidota bacterium]|nr:hypothetical protein [Bacteroidota bacterium]
MNENQIRVLGVLITNSQKEAGKVQYTLTKYGCSLKTRLGINIPDNKAGLMILELTGNTGEMDYLQNALEKLEGVQVKSMVFD